MSTTSEATVPDSPLPDGPPSELVVELGVEMHTRDGVRLVSDVYRPAEGRWPVIVHRNPYDRTDAAMGSHVIVDPAWLARHGFAVVVQDARGRGGSDGEYDMFYQEVDDGYDCVEWAAAQPWSNGVVGAYGSSGMAVSAYQAIAGHPPSLKAVVAFVGTPNMELQARSAGGLFETGFMTWYASMMSLDTVGRIGDPARAAELTQRLLALLGDPITAAATLPLTEVDVIADPTIAPFWSEWLHPTPDGPRSQLPSLAKDPSLGDVALLHVTGYRDFINHGTFDLARAQGDNPNHRLIAGPWAHRGVYMGTTGARELPGTSSPAGPLGWGPLLAAWFDIHLRGGDGSGFPLGLTWLQGDPITYYVEGQNSWATAPSWPPAAIPQEWRLTSDGDARSASGNGRLVAPDSSSAQGSNTFQADPGNPFPTCGGALGLPWQGPDAIQDQRAVDGRSDCLVYTSDPLDRPLTIVGRQQVVLHLESSAPDADIHATLVDIEPDGFAYNVCAGAVRTRYRSGGTEDWLTPGAPTEITVQTHDTAHTFKPGHRIRVMVAGANWPRFSRNLHTKTVPEQGTLDEAVVAEHTVHHSDSFPSRLILHEHKPDA